jgi:hypothetical protein
VSAGGCDADAVAEAGGADVLTDDGCACADVAAEAGATDVPEEGGCVVVVAATFVGGAGVVAEVFGGWFVCCAATTMAKTTLQQTSRIEDVRFIGSFKERSGSLPSRTARFHGTSRGFALFS